MFLGARGGCWDKKKEWFGSSAEKDDGLSDALCVEGEGIDCFCR